MTRLLTTGYETGDVAESGVGTTGGSTTLTVVSSTPTPRAGTYCLKVGTSGSSLTATTAKTWTLAAAKTDLWVRCAFYSHLVGGGALEVVLMTMQDSAGASQCSVSYTNNDGLLRLYRGLSTTLLATASIGFAQDSWHAIEVRTQITSTTVGVSEVWVDGSRVINFSGDNTQTTNANVQGVVLGACNTVSSVTAGTYIAFDDIAINDTAGTINNGRPGDGRVLLLSPSGAGSTTTWVRGGTDTGANYSQVNELPPSMAQYVSSPTIANRDLYAIADVPITISSVNVVEVLALAQNSDAGGGNIAPTVKSGATTNEAATVALTTSPNYVVGRWETDPNTSAAWTLSAVNALEAGATVR